jgi:hypothetical protein
MSQLLDQTSLLVLTCIHEKLGPFADRILDRLTNNTTSKWFTEQAPLDLARIYAGHPPRSNKRELRAVMWKPRTLPDWTAFYVNAKDGWAHFFGKVSQAGGGPETMSVRSTLPVENWGVQEFTYRKADAAEYKPTRLLQWLEEENGYRLVQRGEPLPFESNFKKDNPIETRTDLLAFVRAFGIDVEDDELWTTDTDAIYLNQTWLKTKMVDED